MSSCVVHFLFMRDRNIMMEDVSSMYNVWLTVCNLHTLFTD